MFKCGSIYAFICYPYILEANEDNLNPEEFRKKVLKDRITSPFGCYAKTHAYHCLPLGAEQTCSKIAVLRNIPAPQEAPTKLLLLLPHIYSEIKKV
ncbi:hypothetical protein CDAR_22121 [Caerostris darwini]|uniref:Uncharacterized protein n=1 Tax=Caerostris darwini TaxID=1538125 RepID=A0AAV4P865_9ARAC|nr:hypothetical protein CDAR_22121 [Caerostris darwini]